MNWTVNTALITAVFCCAWCQSAVAQQAPVEIVDLAQTPADEPARSGIGAEQSTPYYDFRKRGGMIYSQGDDYALTCDMYLPQGDGPGGTGPFPAVLAVHGGAWRGGSKLHMTRHAWHLARHGYVVMAINYRHAPKYKFPAQLHDCKAAVRWLRQNATEYRIDPDRIAAFGYSSGGHLVALLGTTQVSDGLEGDEPARDDSISSRVQAVVAGGAPCEFSWIGESSPALVYWLGATRQENPQVYLRASPTHYATGDDPPFYFFHGENDIVVPSSTSDLLRQRLESCGVNCQYDRVLGKGHVATFTDLTWMNRAVDFLNRSLNESDK